MQPEIYPLVQSVGDKQPSPMLSVKLGSQGLEGLLGQEVAG